MTDQQSTDNTNELIRFDSRVEAAEIALQLIRQAKREICFFGANIDPVLFDQPELIDCISEFARRSDKTSVKFVVHSSQVNVQSGHRFLPLLQRLTSSIHVHTSAKQHQKLSQMFLIVDQSGYLYCQNYQRYIGKASFHDPLEARSLKQTFDDIWDHSTVDVGTRRLHL